MVINCPNQMAPPHFAAPFLADSHKQGWEEFRGGEEARLPTTRVKWREGSRNGVVVVSTNEHTEFSSCHQQLPTDTASSELHDLHYFDWPTVGLLEPAMTSGMEESLHWVGPSFASDLSEYSPKVQPKHPLLEIYLEFLLLCSTPARWC